MLKHATFALVLVAAAFAGGAAMNGPGLAWLRKAIGAGPSIIVDADPASAPGPAPAPAKTKRFPTARAEPFRVDLARARPEPRKAGPSHELAPAEPALPAESPSTPAAALIRLPGAPEAEVPAMPAPSALPPARLAGREPAAPGALPPLELPPDPTPAKSDPVARLASNSNAPPAAAPPEGMPAELAPPASAPPAPDPTPATAPAPAPGREWAEIRRRLKELGVTRYRIESETDRRVRFSCVIPVEGLRAVAHQFEAEGDDEPRAAEAALKRVALWRATEAK